MAEFEVTIRAVEPGDALGLSRVQVDTWRDAYVGVLPDDTLLDLDEVTRAAETAWKTLKRLVLDGVDDPSSALRGRIADSVVRIGESLRDDAELRDKVDNWIVRGAQHVVTRYGSKATTIISETIQRWDAGEASRRIELHVGRDLQFIRINGTVVGALAGLVIYTIAQILF